MAVEDIKGYKPHTDAKVEKVNAIKEIENELGAMFSLIEKELTTAYSNGIDLSESELDELAVRIEQISIAKYKLKESSMWACRSVFCPEEKY